MKTHKCNCGHLIDIMEYFVTVEETAYADGEDSCLEEEFECEVCGSQYSIEVEATISVTSELLSIECIHETTAELNGVGVGELLVGDLLDVPNGTYQVGTKQYQIEGGTLVAIFNYLIDENQLQLAI